MATDKPRLVIYADDITIDKLDILADKFNRSRGNMAETIIKEWLVEHEQVLLETVSYDENNQAERLKAYAEKIRNNKKKKSDK